MPYVGQKVLEEGSFLFHNCLKFYLDKNLRYPVRLSLNDMLPNIQFEVEGKTLTLFDVIGTLEKDQSFKWLIYGQYQRIDNLNDEITEMEIIPSDDMKGFITTKVSRLPLKNGSRFKVLFTLTRNDAFEKFMEFSKPQNVAFGIKGRAQRIIEPSEKKAGGKPKKSDSTQTQTDEEVFDEDIFDSEIFG
jgi:hypothetical protein